MAMDPDEVLFLQLEYADQDLQHEAERLSDPTYAYARWMDYTLALLKRGCVTPHDPFTVMDVAAVLVVRELRSARYR